MPTFFHIIIYSNDIQVFYQPENKAGLVTANNHIKNKKIQVAMNKIDL